jgi:hypothetical protein
MTDLPISAANVSAYSNAFQKRGRAGETISAGQMVYRADINAPWLLASADAVTAAARHPAGLALNSAAIGQPLFVAASGDVDLGSVLIPGKAYYLSDTPGGIESFDDVEIGNSVCLIGIANSDSILAIDINAPDVARPGIGQPIGLLLILTRAA